MPTRSNVLCGCGSFMLVAKNGITVEELDGNGDPYKLWRADLYKCGKCHAEVITGFGSGPIAEQWQQPKYADLKAQAYADTTMRVGED